MAATSSSAITTANNNNHKASSTIFPSFLCNRPLLLSVIVLQWVLITFLLSQLMHRQTMSATSEASVGTKEASLSSSIRYLGPPMPCTSSAGGSTSSGSSRGLDGHRNDFEDLIFDDNDAPPPSSLPGVGVTVSFIRHPFIAMLSIARSCALI